MSKINNKHKSRIIFALPDMHLPYMDWNAIEKVAEEIKIAKRRGDDVTVVQLGDLMDQRAWSRFPKEGDADNAQHEWDLAEKCMQRLHKLIPEMTIIFGNHDSRIAKKATEVYLPKQLVKTLDKHFNFDGWKWHTSDDPLVIDGIAFIHGDSFPIPRPISAALRLGQSVVFGHTHQSHLSYVTTHNRTMFALNCGWLGDETQSAFRYASGSPHKCWKGYGVIIDGTPHLIPID
jgi:predicted phosphodiesterase